MRVTADEIIALNPCGKYPPVKVCDLIGKGKTPMQIAKAKTVPVEDRRWVLTQLAARTDGGRRALVLWAAGCAADVLHLLDGDSYNTAAQAIALTVAWADGQDVSRYDLLDAAAAAYTAAYAAYAAADAARAAAYAAARAAYAAAEAAAAYAAAAYAASDAAAPEKQLIDLAAAIEDL